MHFSSMDEARVVGVRGSVKPVFGVVTDAVKAVSPTLAEVPEEAIQYAINQQSLSLGRSR